MIANARMYAVTPPVGALWRSLLERVLRKSGPEVDIVDHRPPAPISELWQRPDKAAVLMCGLPYSRATPRPGLVAAPVPSPPEYGGHARYWTDLVVRADAPFHSLEETFGHRLALTTPESQSGCAAVLYALMVHGGRGPLYREIIEPRFTPMGALTAVIDGKAEVAPLDSYALALLVRHAPQIARQVRVVARTEPTAIPAFVASGPARTDLVAAFLAADDDPDARSIMDQLLLCRFVSPDGTAYDALRQRFQTMRAFWRRHRLAETVHPVFAGEFGERS
jgi:ABC-type phosphate/phosphonate transport system substrate-binding protein